VGRDGNTEQACDEIDFVIIRFNISSADGMEIMDLLLTCLVNETTNETAIVYSYVSTKLNGTSAVMMNLPISVLQYVPWFCNFSDSQMGLKPETFGDWFWKSLKTLINLIVGVIIKIAMVIVELVKLIIDFFIFIFMDVLPLLGHILWLILRVIILIFAWIMFALTLLIFNGIFLLFTIPVISISSVTQCTYKISLNRITLENEEHFLEFMYSISFEYFEFFDIFLPTLYSSITTKNSSITLSYNLFNPFEISSLDFISDIFNEDKPQSSMNKSSPKPQSLQASSSQNIADFTSNFLTAFSIVSATVFFIGITSIVLKNYNDYIKLAASIISIFALIIGLTAIGITMLKEETSDGFWIGFSVGSMVAFLITSVIIGLIGSINIKSKNLWKSITSVGLLIMSIIALVYNILILSENLLNLESDDPKKISEEIGNKIVITAISLILGASFIGLSNKEDQNREMMKYAIVGMGFFALFIVIALWDLAT
jgi:hypothetical protein